MRYIQTNKAPAAVGPYSQAVLVDNMVYCSGQIGLSPDTGTLAEGIEAQTKQVLTNLAAVLQEAGTDLEQVVKTTIYLTNIEDFAVVNDIYASFFGAHKPARATVGVAKLPKGAIVEIDAVAVVTV